MEDAREPGEVRADVERRDEAADDLAVACEILAEKGGLHPHDRKRAKTGTGY